MRDVLTVIWKEAREIVAQQGSSIRNGLGILFALLLVGVVIPWRSGAGFVTNGPGLFVSGWIPLFIAIQVTTDSFAGERERHTLETLLATRLSDAAILLGKIIASFILAWCLMILMVALQLMTVNLAYGHGKLILFPARSAAALVVFSALLYALVCSAGVLFSLHAPTARQAAQTLSFAMLGSFFAVTFGFRALPFEWQKAFSEAMVGDNQLRFGVYVALALAVVNVVLFYIARFRFQRYRLILD